MGANRLIEVENITQVRRMIRDAGADVKKAVRQLDKDVATEAGQYTAEFTPELTGKLVRSIKFGADNKGGFIEAGTGKRTPHAPVQHWGWPAHGIERSGFIIRGLGKAARENGGTFEEMYLARLKKVLTGLGEVT